MLCSAERGNKALQAALNVCRFVRVEQVLCGQSIELRFDRIQFLIGFVARRRLSQVLDHRTDADVMVPVAQAAPGSLADTLRS